MFLHFIIMGCQITYVGVARGGRCTDFHYFYRTV